MEEIKKEGWVIGVMALLFAVINRINQNAEINRVFVFTEPGMRWKYYVMTVVALAVSFLFFAFLIWIVFELGRWHHKKCEEYIKYFLVYFVIQLVILILIWPGNFKQDEIYLTTHAVMNMTIYWTQSFFTQMHYTISLMIFPYIASVVFFQIVIISLLASGIMLKVAGIIEKKRLVWFLLMPFLLLPVLDSNLFPLRNSMICWIYSFLMVSVYTEYTRKQYIGKTCAGLTVFLSVLIGIWKTEFLYLVPAMVLLLFFCMDKTNTVKMKVKKYIGILMIAGVSYFILTIPNRFFQPLDNYAVTAIATPIAEILVNHQYDYAGAVKKEFRVWDDFLGIDTLADDKYLGYDTPQVFLKTPPVSKEKERQIIYDGIKICVYYWKEFFDNRYRIYNMANGYPNIINHGWSTQPEINGTDVYNAHFRYTHLTNPKLKKAVISFLACRKIENYLYTNHLYPILYNSTWAIVIIFAIGMRFLFKKRYFNATLCAIILCQVILVFLAEPAFYFMYYMPFYLSSYTMVMIFVIEWLDKKYAKKQITGMPDEDIKEDLSEHTEEYHATDRSE